MIRAGDLERRTYQGLYHPVCFVCDKLVDSVEEKPLDWDPAFLITIKCHQREESRVVSRDWIAKNERIIAFKPPAA